MKKDNLRSTADEALTLALSSLDDESLPLEGRLELFRTAARLLDGCKADIVKRAAAWNGIGVCLFRSHAGSKAEEEAFSHSLNLLRRSPDHADGEFAASVMSNLAECLLRAGKRERAYELYSDTLDMLRRHLPESDDAAERYALCVCAMAQCRRGRDTLREHRRRTRALRRGAGGNPRRMKALGLCRSVEGVMLCSEGRYRASERVLGKAYTLYTASGAELSELAQLNLQLAKTAQQRGKLADAAELTDLAIAMVLAEFPEMSDILRIELADRIFALASMHEQLGELEEAAKLYGYSANFLHCCAPDEAILGALAEREALSHYLAGTCLVRMESPLYYDAMTHYTRALASLDRLPDEETENQRRTILGSRADIFEAFGEGELAAADYTA